jgi:hypothetical protein
MASAANMPVSAADKATLMVDFVVFHNTRRYYESLGNLTPANIYFGCGSTILARRQNIKHQIIELRRRLHQ